MSEGAASILGLRVVQRVVFPADKDLDVLPLYMDSNAVANSPMPDEKPAMAANVTSVGTDLHPDDLLGRRSVRVRAGKRLSFGSYFNAFPAAYWRKWTTVFTVSLRVQTSGSGSLVVYRSNARGVTQRVESFRVSGESTNTHDLSLAQFGDGGWYWFDLIADAEGMTLVSADWSVPDNGKPAGRLNIGVTTFNRADYCSRTIAAIAADPALREVLHEMIVVDQGNEKVQDEADFDEIAADMGAQLRIINQPNLGGSGGFSRNMLETVNGDTADYVLLLDDDVVVETEGILRSATFADFCRVPTIVGGHMFDMFDRSVLHAYAESVNMWKFLWGPSGELYHRHNLATQNLRATPWMHRRWDVDFNGWWMCLIPTSVIKEIGLSLPVFIKWDDAEYGLRAKAAGYPTVSMPGTAVWHVSWIDKDDSVDWQAYFHSRNRLVAGLIHSPYSKGGDLLKQSLAVDVKHIFSMQYYAASARVMALRDVLSGPDHMHRTIGTRAAELRAMKNDFADSSMQKDPGAFPPPRRRKPPRKGQEPSAPKLYALGPWLAKTLVKQTAVPASEMSGQNPETAIAHQDSKWWRLSQLDSAVVSNADGSGASWYKRDAKKARSLLRESILLHLELRQNWDELQLQYRTQLGEVTSGRAWESTINEAAARDSAGK
ncbi:glycosyltransferase [Arthrobacter sp. EM1]|uniref:glycosyltransferase n=1 Tax=Arthrobacter sp. EM1 TaxID=3043847 RepID=UPI00249F5740|nr:glycosyltransferase [Arthrobacter sp. EM1]WGZ78448.1 glycosyltransferase [Arthrobacter sp. EM1]